MLLIEAEAAPLGDNGGEGLLSIHGKVGEGERDGERSRVGLPVGLWLGDSA